MKKLTLITLTILLTNTLASAQVKSFAFSLSASPTLSRLKASGEDVTKNAYGVGFDFGINADFFLDDYKKYAITTGLIISNLNSKVKYSVLDEVTLGNKKFSATNLTVDYRIRNLEVPIAIKLRTKEFNDLTFWGQFGTFLGVNIAAKASTNDNQLTKTNIGSDFRALNAGLNIGLGAELNLGESNAASVGIVYRNGFVNMLKSDLGDKSTTNVIALQCSFVF